MPFDQETLDRLRDLGMNTEKWLASFERMRERDGDEAFRQALGEHEGNHAQAREWLPVLREYAAEFRSARPMPEVRSLSREGRAEYELLRKEMASYMSLNLEYFVTRPYHVLVVATTRVGLRAAANVFAYTTQPVVILTVGEAYSLFGRNPPRYYGSPPWYVEFEWSLFKGFEHQDLVHSSSCSEADIRGRFPIPEGHDYWFSYFEQTWGHRTDPEEAKVWGWDGERATLLGRLGPDPSEVPPGITHVFTPALRMY